MGKRNLRLDYGYNVKTGTVNYHWNQKGTFPNFGIADHTPVGTAGRVLYKSARYFKYAGRTLLVVGIALDVYSVVKADKPLRQAAKLVSGWAGAWVGCKVVGAGGGLGRNRSHSRSRDGCRRRRRLRRRWLHWVRRRVPGGGPTVRLGRGKLRARSRSGWAVTRGSDAGQPVGRLERLVLWPTFTGAEWQLPTQVPGTERLLIGWRWAPEPVDGGPPPAVAKLLATALTRHGPLTFASATRPFAGGAVFRPRLRETFVWATSADADEATQGIFAGDAFNWDLRGQVAILGTPGVPLTLDERFLQLASDSRLFAELPSLGAKGVLLPGVDSAVAGLYFFDPQVGGAVRNELEDLTRAAGGRCMVVAQRDTFAAELRA